MSKKLLFAVLAAVYFILVIYVSSDNPMTPCESKGLELKTSSYDIKKKKFVIWCKE